MGQADRAPRVPINESHLQPELQTSAQELVCSHMCCVWPEEGFKLFEQSSDIENGRISQNCGCQRPWQQLPLGQPSLPVPVPITLVPVATGLGVSGCPPAGAPGAPGRLVDLALRSGVCLRGELMPPHHGDAQMLPQTRQLTQAFSSGVLIICPHPFGF